MAALTVTHPAANHDRRSLGQLFGQLEQLMEDALGVKARPISAACVTQDCMFTQGSIGADDETSTQD